MASADYDVVGQHYSNLRQPDPRIAKLIHAELESAVSIVNIGAGTGSYEPTGKVIALDARVRSAISTFSRISNIGNGLRKLQQDLESGKWREKHGHILELPEYDFGYRLVTTDIRKTKAMDNLYREES